MKIAVGITVGRWLVLAPAPPVYRRRLRAWCCRCSCGRERVVVEETLVRGKSRGCGCTNPGNFKHGHARNGTYPDSAEYRAWQAMKYRCFNESSPAYRNYGGRGITVCPEWSASFDAFYAHVGSRPGPSYSIDRIDNNRGYEPGNVRWATKREQTRNTRYSRHLIVNGRTQVLADWAAELGVHPAAILYRLKQGWPVARAVSEPKRQSR